MGGNHRVDPRVFDFRMPRLKMGCGAVGSLPAAVASLGRRVCVVTDPGMAAQPAFAACVAALEESGLRVAVFGEVQSDPPIEVVGRCVAVARAADAEVMVGIGGGSSLDVTKLSAVLARHGGAVEALFGTGKIPGRGLPTVLLPTTAGTGSEVTPIAILSDIENNMKRGVVSDHLYADVALVDPELCMTLPPEPTAYTGMDALAHALESYTNRFAVPLIDTFALEAIRLICGNLRRCVRDGRDRDARYAMSLASLMGGLCLGSVNTAAVHALAYPLGGTYHVPHGVAISLLLPHVVRFNAPACRERYARLGETLGSSDPVAVIETLSRDVGTARRMREFGVTEDDLPRMARAAMDVQRLLKNNPRDVAEEDALAIYQAAW